MRRALPAPVPQRGPRWQAVVGPGTVGSVPTDGEWECWPSLRMKGHSCYAMCGAGAALGERTANTVRTGTRQDGKTLYWSQQPERVL